jgi:hypothetical protein
MALQRHNVAGITLATQTAKRDIAKVGFTEVPIPRKTHVQSYAMLDKWGGRVT